MKRLLFVSLFTTPALAQEEHTPIISLSDAAWAVALFLAVILVLAEAV